MAGATASDYIKHHLQNLTYGKLPAGYERTDGTVLSQDTWTMAHGAQEASDMGFMAIHVDTIGWSLFLGALFLFFFRMAAKKATSGVPGGLQPDGSHRTPSYIVAIPRLTGCATTVSTPASSMSLQKSLP